jgi:WD40 repeat protein
MIKSPARGLLDLIDDCERFVLRSFEGIEQSAMHIYHSAIPWAPTSSLTRKLYEHELITETKLLNAVDAAWDACIRITSVGDPAKAVVFSHKGGLIAAQCVPGDPQDLLGSSRVKVFDAMTGAIRATFEERKRTYSIAFSPDDGLLASGLLHGTIHIWDVRTGTLFKMLEGHSWEVCSVAFSPCSTMIASGSRDRTVRIWSIPSGHCDCVLMGHSGVVTDVCWLATGGKVISSSLDRTVRIWDVQKQTCSKIFREYAHRVTTVTLSPLSFLMAFANGEMRVYDSQSCEIIRAISYDGLIQSQFSPGGDEVFLTKRNSGYIWDLTRTTPVWAIDYGGDYATFSPDGTRIASIYGKFLKIWKIETGYKHHNTSTHIHDKALANVYISPDEQLVAFNPMETDLCFVQKNPHMESVQILDATTGLHFFTFVPDDWKTSILSIVFLPNSEFIACLLTDARGLPRGARLRDARRLPRSVQIWNTQSHKEDMTIEMDNDVFHIALSSDGSRLVCLSSSDIKLLDLEREAGERCLAHLELDYLPPQKPQDCQFSIDGMRVSIEGGCHTKSWLISPNDFDTNGGSLLPMVFVPITQERPCHSQNPDAFAASQSYRCAKDGEWILDQHGSHVLWIPPDERLRRIWSKRCGRKVVVQTEGGKIYIVDFSSSRKAGS